MSSLLRLTEKELSTINVSSVKTAQTYRKGHSIISMSDILSVQTGRKETSSMSDVHIAPTDRKEHSIISMSALFRLTENKLAVH